MHAALLTLVTEETQTYSFAYCVRWGTQRFRTAKHGTLQAALFEDTEVKRSAVVISLTSAQNLKTTFLYGMRKVCFHALLCPS